MELSISIDDRQVRRAIARFGPVAKREVNRAFKRIGGEFVREFTKTTLRNKFPGQSEDRFRKAGSRRSFLFRRTGTLARNLMFETGRGANLNQAYVRIGWLDKHSAMIAWTHETGATIRSSRPMTIPLGAALTATGATRKPARAWGNTFVAKGVIWQKRGNRAVPLFVLTDRVRIPKRLYFRVKAERFLRKGPGEKILDEMANAILEAL